MNMSEMMQALAKDDNTKLMIFWQGENYFDDHERWRVVLTVKKLDLQIELKVAGRTPERAVEEVYRQWIELTLDSTLGQRVGVPQLPSYTDASPPEAPEPIDLETSEDDEIPF